MSKKIIVIIIVLSIVMTMVILPISSSADLLVPFDYVLYTFTHADFVYLFENNYLSLYYLIDGGNASTGVSNNGWRVISGGDYATITSFCTNRYTTIGTYSLSISLHLPFTFSINSGTILCSPNVRSSSSTFNYVPALPSNSIYFSLGDDLISSVPCNNYRTSYNLYSSFFGYGAYYDTYHLSSGFPRALIDSFGTSISSYNQSSCQGFFALALSVYLPSDVLSAIKDQSQLPSNPSDPGGDPSDPGGDPSDPGGDPSDPGTGSVDFTPLIGYLESLNSENQSTVDTIQSKTDTSIEGLSSSSEQAMDFFNDSESLKTDIIGSTEDYDSFLDSLDLSKEISVTYDGDSYTFDPMQGLDLIGGRIKSLFSFPLFYFIIFMLFFLALASYVIYGRA